MAEPSRKEANRKKREYWQSHIDAWRRSGMSQADYCREKELTRHRFTYWKCKLDKILRPVTFVPVLKNPDHLRQASNPSAPLKLILRERYRVEVGDGFSSHTLERLIRTLGNL